MNIKTRACIRKKVMEELEYTDKESMTENIKNIIKSQGQEIEELELGNIIKNYVRQREEKEEFGINETYLYWLKADVIGNLLLAVEEYKK